ncbi:hypothetical protein MO973_13655 [Paenibacillus sp. TRM 82003]|nr:hypothetical protein [Paenibacillus sp. TRM 82003]
MSERTLDFSLVNAYFHISPDGFEEPVLTIRAVDALRDEAAAKKALFTGGELAKATGPELPASFWGLSFFNLCATEMLFMAQQGCFLDLSFDNLWFQLESHGDHAHLGYKIDRLAWEDAPAEGRARFLEERLTRMIEKDIAPAVRTVARAAGVKPEMIWLQYGARMAFLRDYLRENEPREDVLRRFESDDAVLSALPAELFGTKRNPFVHTPRYVDSPYKPGSRMMIRSACCMYYCREDGEKCYNCPKLTETEREARYAAILTEAAAQR